MAVGKHSLHKQAKTGQLPGDLSVQTKVSMLERGPEPASKQALSFRRDHFKAANRRFRHQLISHLMD